MEERQARVSAIGLRPVRAGDVPAVVDIVRAVLAEFGLEFGVGSATDDDVLRLPGSYWEAGGMFWVAEDPCGEILGTCGVYPVEPGTLELRKMYVRPEARGRGVGRLLLDHAIAEARASGARRIVLDTLHTMQAAVHVYERAGFARDDAQIRGARCTRGYRLDL
jgi:putative acetyltransferase